jgi:hypothetical protein
MSSGGHGAYPQQTTKEIGLDRGLWVSMRNLKFGFFENSGLPVESRILIFYSFETEDRLARSGILHFLIPERRFVGPRHAAELTSAALEFLNASGRLPSWDSDSGSKAVAPPSPARRPPAET